MCMNYMLANTHKSKEQNIDIKTTTNGKTMELNPQKISAKTATKIHQHCILCSLPTK